VIQSGIKTIFFIVFDYQLCLNVKTEGVLVF